MDAGHTSLFGGYNRLSRDDGVEGCGEDEGQGGRDNGGETHS